MGGATFMTMGGGAAEIDVQRARFAARGRPGARSEEDRWTNHQAIALTLQALSLALPAEGLARRHWLVEAAGYVLAELERMDRAEANTGAPS